LFTDIFFLITGILFDVYILLSNSASDGGKQLKYTNVSTITSSSFDSSKDSRILINGWYVGTVSSRANNFDWINSAKAALFAKQVRADSNSSHIIE